MVSRNSDESQMYGSQLLSVLPVLAEQQPVPRLQDNRTMAYRGKRAAKQPRDNGTKSVGQRTTAILLVLMYKTDPIRRGLRSFANPTDRHPRVVIVNELSVILQRIFEFAIIAEDSLRSSEKLVEPWSMYSTTWYARVLSITAQTRAANL